MPYTYNPTHTHLMWAVRTVASNWRIRKRLPRITRLAIKLGYIKKRDQYSTSD